MQKSKSIRIIASLLIALVLSVSIPFPITKAKSYTEKDVQQMFKGDTELDTEKVLDIIAGMDLTGKQRNFFKAIIRLPKLIEQ